MRVIGEAVCFPAIHVHVPLGVFWERPSSSLALEVGQVKVAVSVPVPLTVNGLKFHFVPEALTVPVAVSVAPPAMAGTTPTAAHSKTTANGARSRANTRRILSDRLAAAYSGTARNSRNLRE